ncbi:MAG: beta-propeller fold lactonase family protein [Lachnospiraceae bacterium]|nr:beta-propeller fold lactonase family protein [Lachnospiraceae bacterium]
MKQEKYVAYVGTYTHKHSQGIHIYDLDVENGTMEERKAVRILNASDLIVSSSGKYLYSITDDGVQSFKILPDGDLEPMNEMWSGGMRGCYLDVDENDKYLFIGGYHDGRVSMLQLSEDGKIGAIADNIFHKGMGRSAANRGSRPHINCVKVTPDQKYLCAVDGGLDHVKVYEIDYTFHKLQLVDIVRCDLESAPKMIRFSKDGKNAYILNELKNTIDVYDYYVDEKRGPEFERIQSISTEDKKDDSSSSQNMEFSKDGKYLYCANADSDAVTIFERDDETGHLKMLCITKISGIFPKALAVFPDGRHFMSLNHESDEISTYRVFHEEGYALMHGKPCRVDEPNCVYIHKLNSGLSN